ncbi:hypothetical protein JXA56_02510 [Candidatus Micrarchaeota archaeon]|nr:hypothetical protein [Candidatus Micrarchaeota archaeon]
MPQKLKPQAEQPLTMDQRQDAFLTHCRQYGLPDNVINNPEFRKALQPLMIGTPESNKMFHDNLRSAIGGWVHGAYISGKIDLGERSIRMVSRDAGISPAELKKARDDYIRDARDESETVRIGAIEARYHIGSITPRRAAEPVKKTSAAQSDAEHRNKELREDGIGVFQAMNDRGRRAFLVDLMEQDAKLNERLETEGSQYRSNLLGEFMRMYSRETGVTANDMIAKYGAEPMEKAPEKTAPVEIPGPSVVEDSYARYVVTISGREGEQKFSVVVKREPGEKEPLRGPGDLIATAKEGSGREMRIYTADGSVVFDSTSDASNVMASEDFKKEYGYQSIDRLLRDKYAVAAYASRRGEEGTKFSFEYVGDVKIKREESGMTAVPSDAEAQATRTRKKKLA